MKFLCLNDESNRSKNVRCLRQCATCASRDETRLITTMETEPTGTFFDFADPQATQVHVVDIARSLSQKIRFGGHTTSWYSVAEHALLVRDLVIADGHPELAFPALHHDSHETYIDDIPTPLKTRIEQLAPGLIAALQVPIDVAIAERFGFDPALFEHPAVKRADLLALFREAATLKKSRGVGPHWGRTEPAEPLSIYGMSPTTAERTFLATHNLEIAQCS